MDHDLLTDLARCIVAAWLLGVAAHLLKQPVILAYLIAGFIVGPEFLGWVKARESIETISTLGLILLLFMIGLEIDLKKMLGAGRLISLTTLAQLLGSCLLGFLFFRLLGFPFGNGAMDALYLAVALAMSSTIIIVKLLYEKRELDTLPGRITLGILVLQDLFAILFLAVQPNLSEPGFGVVASSLVKTAGLVAAAFAISKYGLPPLFRAVARVPELVLAGALAWCFLVAGAAQSLDLSREMGALVAGIAFSTFPYTLDVTAKVTSLRDFFVTLFFVGLGMSIPEPTWGLLAMAAGFSLFLVATRLLTIFPPLYFMKQGHRAGLLPAINLGQVSELSLVIVTLGAQASHVQSSTQALLAYTFVILAVASSYAILHSEKLYKGVSPVLTRIGYKDLGTSHSHPEAETSAEPTIYLLGFCWTASSLLEDIGRKHPGWLSELAVIDFNPHVHHQLKHRKIKVIYGDIAQRETLLHAGVQNAKIIVCTLPNTVLKGINNLRLLKQLREINPSAQMIMHAELLADVPRLYAAGADYVSIPRLAESLELCGVLEAARHQHLAQKRAELDRELASRQEVIS